MFISFALNEIMDQQSDPENIRGKSLFGCRAVLPHRSQGGAETASIALYNELCEEKAATSVVSTYVINGCLL